MIRLWESKSIINKSIDTEKLINRLYKRKANLLSKLTLHQIAAIEISKLSARKKQRQKHNLISVLECINFIHDDESLVIVQKAHSDLNYVWT